MSDDGNFDGLDGSWETGDPSDAEDNLIASTNLKKTSDKSVYGDQPDAKVATLGDPIPIEDQLRDALRHGLSSAKPSVASGCSELPGSNLA